MEELRIDKTDSTPLVDFQKNGSLIIEGRVLSEDPFIFFTPLLKWVKEFGEETIKLEVKLDYMNTSSTKMMNELIKTIDANTHINNKVINWYYEEDDEDMMELGQIIEENTFSTKFFFFGMTVTYQDH